MSKNTIFGLNLLPDFWTPENAVYCPWALDFRPNSGGPKSGQGKLADLDALTQPSIEFYAAQLKEISLGDKIEKAQLLFKGIQLSPDEIEYTRQKSFVTQYLMPILEDLQVTCDLRAIFRSLPSGSTTSEDHENRLQTLLGFTPIAIVSLELNDAAGNEDVSTFQLTESDLKFVIKIFQEALT